MSAVDLNWEDNFTETLQLIRRKSSPWFWAGAALSILLVIVAVGSLMYTVFDWRRDRVVERIEQLDDTYALFTSAICAEADLMQAAITRIVDSEYPTGETDGNPLDLSCGGGS